MMEQFDPLRLDAQMCFPLYAASREVIKRYHPYLEEVGLTYTQYVTMMVVWEKQCISASDLGKRLYLDSGTLTPVLKALEQKGYISRKRSKEDERLLIIALTEEGSRLKTRCMKIPESVGACVPVPKEDAAELYRLLYELLDRLK